MGLWAKLILRNGLNHEPNLIDVSPEEHRKLKAIAALKGKSLKEYLLEGKISLGADDQEEALVELEALLDVRIEQHRKSGLKGRSSASAILQDITERC